MARTGPVNRDTEMVAAIHAIKAKTCLKWAKTTQDEICCNKCIDTQISKKTRVMSMCLSYRANCGFNFFCNSQNNALISKRKNIEKLENWIKML